MMLAAIFFLASAAITPVADNTTAVLRAKDQALLDAIAPGDQASWAAALTDDAVYIDENGTIFDRAGLLKTIVPLPASTSGSIAITDYSATITGDVAFVIHKDEEHENFHGQKLVAHYLMSEVWRRGQGGWKLASVHAYVVAVDPPSIQLPTAKLDRLVGRYDAAEDLHLEIGRQGDQLVSTINGGKPLPFLAETSQVFFSPGRPRVRFIFPEGDGQPASVIERREGEDIRWTRAG